MGSPKIFDFGESGGIERFQLAERVPCASIAERECQKPIYYDWLFMLRMGHRSHARREVFGHLRCALLIADGDSQNH